jgi:hypothetical protein
MSKSHDQTAIEPSGNDTPPQHVRRLIEVGKCKQAVELAKAEHKKRPSPESEELLVKAYVARIEQFRNKGAAEDARTLLNLVRERFPAHRGRLEQLDIQVAAGGDQVDALVAPLAQPGLRPEVKETIETAIRRQWVDLPELAHCRSLPQDYPLKIAAAAAWRAFEAVTREPVDDERIALPEISRRSPLAGWKMLVRALAAFHRHDDSACRRALEGIPDDDAVARLKPMILAMIEGKPAGTGLAGALHSRIIPDERPLRDAMENIEHALEYQNEAELTRSIRQAVRTCEELHPQLSQRLRQHISVACMMADAPTEAVLTAMGPSLKNAYFWRLLACAMEQDGQPAPAALYWNRFLRHAVAEGLIQPDTPEEAAVHLRAARELASMPSKQLDEERSQLSMGSFMEGYYANQPPAIAALAPKSGRELRDNALNPTWLFRRAAAIDPGPEVFRQWRDWIEKTNQPDHVATKMAEFWREQCPDDPQPLLLLCAQAERRGALKRALDYLGCAEAIDALNSQVRSARLRLTLGTLWRHFKDKKPHLVQKDLEELEALPGMTEGDRGAFLWALKAAWQTMRGDAAQAKTAGEEVIQRIGPAAGEVIVRSVCLQARLAMDAVLPHAQAAPPYTPRAAAEALARTIRLSRQMRLKLFTPHIWETMIDGVLRERPCPLSQADLLDIARTAYDDSSRELAYLATAAGLATPGGPAAATARFLTMRARALPDWAGDRIAQCLRAARELAGQVHDAELMNEVSNEIERISWMRRALSLGDFQESDKKWLDEILQMERRADSFPASRDEAEEYVADLPENDWLPDLGDDEEDDDDDLFGFPDLGGNLDEDQLLEGTTPEQKALIQEILKKYGRIPSPRELLRDDPKLLMKLLMMQMGGPPVEDLIEGMDDLFPGGFGHGGKHKKRKRRKR